jgi:hypothetical protein
MYRSGFASFILLILLFLPPVAGVVYRRALQSESPLDDNATARVRTLENELAVYKRREQARDAEQRMVTAWNETHSAHIGRILPIEDVSPQRHSIWMHCRGNASLEAFSRRTAVVSTAGDLVGRVHSVYHLRERPDADSREIKRTDGVVVVQGLSDPKFAVRFRTDNGWGFLKGTGMREDGRALLDIRHVMGDLELEEGMSLFSDGDAIFPAGILLGKVVSARSGESGHAFQVLAESNPSTLGSVIALVDVAAARASRIVGGSGQR